LFFNVGLAQTLANVFVSVINQTSGFFRPTGHFPLWLQGLNYLFPTYYATKVFLANQFEGQTFTCPGTQALPDGSCPLATGDQVLSNYDVEYDQLWPSFGILFALCFVYRLIGFLILNFKKPTFQN